MTTYDLAVIGGGPGGYSAALRAVELGGKVLLVEKDKFGGTCLNRGCIPTKALVNCADKVRSFQSGLQKGFFEGQANVNYAKMVEHKDQAVQTIRSGLEQLLKKNKIDMVKGKGLVDKPGEVRVELDSGETQSYAAKKIILSTGSKSFLPPVPGIDSEGVLDSEKILAMDSLPEEIIIIGGGYIGIEFAGIFASLGSKVTVVEMLPSILQLLDKDICKRMTQLLKKEGLQIYTKTKVQKIEKQGDKLQVSVEPEAEKDAQPQVLSADKVLVSTGTVPITEGIDIQSLGLEMEGKAIKVDEKMQTNVEGIYAIGDCIPGIQLAHVAVEEASVAAENALGGDRKVDLSVVPNCIFSHPEVGQVGLGEDEAKEAGYKVQALKLPYTAIGKAVAMGENVGMIKLVAEKGTGRLLGGLIMGKDGTEMIAEIAVALKQQMTVQELAQVIHAHPTLSEGIMDAAKHMKI